MQNNDYISRSDVLAQVEWIGEHATWDNLYPEGVSAVTEENIESIPADDVRPVVRGEWIDKGYQPYRMSELSFVKYRHVLECSNCHREKEIKSKFCPDCGADMRSVYKPGSKEAWQSLEKAQEDFRKTAQVIAEGMRGEKDI